jgi:hypothetical protein
MLDPLSPAVVRGPLAAARRAANRLCIFKMLMAVLIQQLSSNMHRLVLSGMGWIWRM